MIFLTLDKKQINISIREEPEKALYEGAISRIEVNGFERDATARAICIRHYGTICSVCGFDFKDKYGLIGEGYIHVHHLIPISLIRENYVIDPIQDLRPICPNCHAMVHRESPPILIDDLREIIRKNR